MLNSSREFLPPKPPGYEAPFQRREPTYPRPRGLVRFLVSRSMVQVLVDWHREVENHWSNAAVVAACPGNSVQDRCWSAGVKGLTIALGRDNE